MARKCKADQCKLPSFSGEYCRYHQHLRTDRKQPSAIKKRSSKQKERMSKYMPIRDQFLKDNPECMVKKLGCYIDSTNVHHGAGKVGEKLFDTKYFIATCDGLCHKWCEENPKEAKELGLSFSRLKKDNDA